MEGWPSGLRHLTANETYLNRYRGFESLTFRHITGKEVMKKFLVAAVVSVAVLAGTIPAHADNSENVIIGILGGALGGLIVGEVIGNNRNRVYAEPPVVYYAQPPVVIYEEYVEPAPVRCVYKKKKIYDPNLDEYRIVKKRVCYR